MLEDNCDKVEEISYMRPFSHDELSEKKDRLSDVSIEINEVEVAKKAQNEVFKAQLKPLAEERRQLLDDIKNKAERIKGECYKFVDQEAGEVGYYSPEGVLIESRPIRQDERQMTIHSIGRTGTNN